MSKGRFSTNLGKRQNKNNAIAFLSVVLGCYALTMGFSYHWGLWQDWTNPENYMIGLRAMFFICSVLLFPPMLAGFVLGAQRGKAKRVRENASFVAMRNTTYDRESLCGLSPALISLLIDLDIYGQKVIVATLLRLQQKKAICLTESSRITITAKTAEPLDRSEAELLDLLVCQNGKLDNSHALQQWKKRRFWEAARLGYIQPKSIPNEKQSLKTMAIACISSCGLAFVLWAIFIASPMMRYPGTAPGAIAAFFYLLVVDSLMFFPIYFMMQKATYKKRGAIVWERTPLGNETAEKIAGLGRFVHKFTQLSKAKQEDAALCKDFLVEAIVLEENKRIVKEISMHYKGNLASLRRL